MGGWVVGGFLLARGGGGRFLGGVGTTEGGEARGAAERCVY